MKSFLFDPNLFNGAIVLLYAASAVRLGIAGHGGASLWAIGCALATIGSVLMVNE